MSNNPSPKMRLSNLSFRIVLVLGVCLVAIVACIAYVDWSAQRRARAFCDGIAIGSDVATAIAEAKSEGILEGPHEGTYSGRTFYFSGVVFSKAVCEVSVGQDGKVANKGSRMERD
jgi:hypothetical protein